ncbi:MAG: AAA family ATPase [Candidatus Omnitrophica bacterium]|nr:AAA family ATPase [Candidatus Omnitrophota bacterium]
MTQTIAVAGKGGCGKTTTSALIVKYLIEKNLSPILAVDADPNSNFGELLGLKSAGRIVDILEEVRKNPSIVPQGTSKERYIEYQVQKALLESQGVDLLTMGRPEGPGCYCYVNTLLRDILNKLMESYRFIIIDNEAGMEHLSRRVVRNMDYLFLVSDYSHIGLKSAMRILDLIAELNLSASHKFLILNKVNRGIKNIEDMPSKIKSLARNPQIESAALIPYDEKVEEISLSGNSLNDISGNSPAYQAISGFCRQVISAA